MVSTQSLRTLFRYVLTGGTAAVVDVSAFAALHWAGLPVALAATCSFCVAAVVNYTLTSIFVFKKPLSRRAFFLFFSVALLGMTINVGVTVAGASLHVGVTVAGVALAPFQPILAKIAGIGTAFLFNFWLNCTFVFRDRIARTHAPAPVPTSPAGAKAP